MKWQKPSKELTLFLEDKLKHIDCQARKMFGCPVYFIDNNMFIGAFRKDVFIRLSTADRERLFNKYKEIRPFTPRAGITMKEYVALPKTLYSKKKVFSDLLRKSQMYVRSLPSKKGRKKK